MLDLENHFFWSKVLDNSFSMGDEKLIEAVRTFPCLWNTTSATFRDVKAKDAAWKQVASQVSVL